MRSVPTDQPSEIRSACSAYAAIAVPCAGRLADLLLEQHPVIAELAQKERGSLRIPLSLDLDASRHATQPSLLALLADHPELLEELDAYWLLPPTG